MSETQRSGCVQQYFNVMELYDYITYIRTTKESAVKTRSSSNCSTKKVLQFLSNYLMCHVLAETWDVAEVQFKIVQATDSVRPRMRGKPTPCFNHRSTANHFSGLGCGETQKRLEASACRQGRQENRTTQTYKICRNVFS